MAPTPTRRKPRALVPETEAPTASVEASTSHGERTKGIAFPIAIAAAVLLLLGGVLVVPAFSEGTNEASRQPAAAEPAPVEEPTPTTLSPQQQWDQAVVGLTSEEQVQLSLFLATPEERQAWVDFIAPSPPPPPPAPKTASTGTSSSGAGVWDRLAQCESGGNWSTSGGSFEGGLQFAHSTWVSFGGTQYAAHAYQASKGQQIAIAEKVLASSGWGAWPGCSRKLGLR